MNIELKFYVDKVNNVGDVGNRASDDIAAVRNQQIAICHAAHLYLCM